MAHAARLGDQDSPTVTEEAEAFGETASYIRDAMSRHEMSACPASEHELDTPQT